MAYANLCVCVCLYMRARVYVWMCLTHDTLQVWAGNPAKKLRDLKPQERQYLQDLPTRYTGLAGQHKEIMHLLKLKQEEYSA